MRSRFLAELTTPEVEGYLRKGGKTALLPVGCVEMHGPHLPIETDTIIAQAFALRLAEKGNGLVLPAIHYSWSGSTDGFAGTISIEPDIVQRTAEQVAVKVRRMGFKRLVVLSNHHGNRYPLYLFARRFYEEHLFPAAYVDVSEPFGDDVRAIFSSGQGNAREGSLLLAALKVLGKPDLYSEKDMAYEARQVPAMKSMRRIAPASVGYFMQDPTHHAYPSREISLKRGLRFMEAQVRHMVAMLGALDEYARDTKAMKNKGWWAGK